MDINTALQEVLKMALTHGSLAHGLHEAAKALDKYVRPDCVILKSVDHLVVRLKSVGFCAVLQGGLYSPFRCFVLWFSVISETRKVHTVF
jgi:hypothetical protein